MPAISTENPFLGKRDGRSMDGSPLLTNRTLMTLKNYGQTEYVSKMSGCFNSGMLRNPFLRDEAQVPSSTYCRNNVNLQNAFSLSMKLPQVSLKPFLINKQLSTELAIKDINIELTTVEPILKTDVAEQPGNDRLPIGDVDWNDLLDETVGDEQRVEGAQTTNDGKERERLPLLTPIVTVQESHSLKVSNCLSTV